MTGRRIDIHTHAMAEGVIAELLARGFKATGGYTISVQWTPEAALAYMDRQGMPADGPEQALTELTYALDELHLDGVVLTSNVAGHYFGGPPQG